MTYNVFDGMLNVAQLQLNFLSRETLRDIISNKYEHHDQRWERKQKAIYKQIINMTLKWLTIWTHGYSP